MVSGGVSAKNIPECNDKNVLRWIEDLYYEKTGDVSRDMVIVSIEYLEEISSQPNMRECEITFRGTIGPKGLAKINEYRSDWINEFGSPPSDNKYLGRISGIGTNSVKFSLHYNLIKKEWFGKLYPWSPDLRNHLFRGFMNEEGRWLQAAQYERERRAREEERIKQEEIALSIKKKKEEEDIALSIKKKEEEEIALSIKKREEEEIALLIKKEEQDEVVKQPTKEFTDCVRKKILITYPHVSRYLKQEGDVIIRLVFINGLYYRFRIISSPYDRLSRAVSDALSSIDCSHEEKFTGSSSIKYKFKLE